MPPKITDTLKAFNNVMLCLVDNYSQDSTLQQLKEIKENAPDNVSVIEIKKQVSNEIAVRAGERYFYSSCNIKHIGYINVHNYT